MKNNDPQSLLFEAINNNQPDKVKELLQNPDYHNMIAREEKTFLEIIRESRAVIVLSTTDKNDMANKINTNEDIARQINDVINTVKTKVSSLNNAIKSNDLGTVKELLQDPTYNDLLITEERNLSKIMRQNRQAFVNRDPNKLATASDISIQINTATRIIKTNKTNSLLEAIKENNLGKVEQFIKDPTYRDAIAQGKDDLLKEARRVQTEILTKRGDGSEKDKFDKIQKAGINGQISVLLKGAVKDAEQKIVQEKQNIEKEIEQEKKNAQKPGLGDRIKSFFTNLVQGIKNIFSSEKKAESNITPKENTLPTKQQPSQAQSNEKTTSQAPTLTQNQQKNRQILNDTSKTFHNAGGKYQGQSGNISQPQASQVTNTSKGQETGRS
jgi:hypothetical protein